MFEAMRDDAAGGAVAATSWQLPRSAPAVAAASGGALAGDRGPGAGSFARSIRRAFRRGRTSPTAAGSPNLLLLPHRTPPELLILFDINH
jgi:hypothetical protein